MFINDPLQESDQPEFTKGFLVSSYMPKYKTAGEHLKGNILSAVLQSKRENFTFIIAGIISRERASYLL